MAYQGVSPYLFANNLTNVQLLDDISGSFNGSTTIFNLTIDGIAFRPEAARGLFIVLGGVVQDPDTDYTVSGSQITFTTAPAAGLTFAGRNIYGLNAINNVNDGVITPAKLTTGGPSWDTSGNLTISGDLIANSLGDVVNLASIDKSITDTAVDIFVYDTSKDSDGGAWRKRTQHTSWYNETLNTATRGSRREFPAVAVIVVESYKLTIYDGDDPDMPMWMVWNRANGSALCNTSDTLTSCKMLNGILCVGKNDITSGGLARIKFIDEEIITIWRGSAQYQYYYKGDISQRNDNLSYSAVNNSSFALVNDNINDVAMTVLPNAPIDPSTGLPIPTIAVATNGGISVIRDDGQVFDMEATSTINYRSNSIAITKNKKIIFNTSDGQTDNYSIFHIIPLSIFTQDRVYSYEYQFLNEGYYAYNANGNSSLDIFSSNQTFFKDVIETQLGYVSIGSNFGLKNVQHISQSLNSGGRSSLGDGRFTGGMQCGITTNYNTGWMHSNIKGAFLSDTDATNVTGTELVTNGTFDTSTTGWTTLNSATLSVDNNQLKITNSGTSVGGAYQSISVEIGKPYTVYVGSHVYGTTNGKYFKIGNSVAGAEYLNTGNASSYVHTFIPTQSTIYLIFQTNNNVNNATSFVDNVSLRLAEPDRSVNNKGLQVFGTITKSPVATGAELVAYSGVSDTNYLRQPYNSDLNFGTGDFSIFVWVLKNNLSSNHYIIDRAPTPFSSTGRSYFIISSTGHHRFRLAGGNEVTGSLRAMPEGVYNHIGFVRKSGNMEFWMNGELVQTVTGSAASASFDDGVTGQILTVDRYADGFVQDYTFDGMALLRISASAPSAEQVKKMYEDEKVLFQENAACTLYGSSDAVTALAYDDSTSLLHAGTSSGRSDFQGLRRINNTTTAVTTAISASNGLIAEQ